MSESGQVTRPDGLLTGVRPRDLTIIASTWLRFAFRSGGGVLSLFMVMVIGLMIVNVSVSQMERVGRFMAGKDASQADVVKKISESNVVRNVVEIVLDGTDDEVKAQSNYLMKEKPAMLSIALLILLYLVPFGVSSAAFNQTAGDIGSRGLRFLLSRTERPNIFLGRFLSAFLFIAGAFALLLLIVTSYLHFKLGIYSAGVLYGWAFRGIIAFTFYSMPYVALAAWVSCLMDKPFAAMAMTYLASVGSTLVLFIIGAILSTAGAEQAWLSRLMPWGWRYDMFHNELDTQLLAYAAMVGFTVLFLFLGLASFRKRDL